MPRDIIAILRGVQPHEVLEISKVLVGAGITTIEVPMNSPESLKVSKSCLKNDCIMPALERGPCWRFLKCTMLYVQAGS